ncbi:bifunctional nuclease family protein [Ignavibacteria bacterium]|nr:bifunctional nuclease family protein [Bacteroidota bacterium]MCZ2132861.1 bifunctional nuclease family protein [Bacteroidota bacterium]
MKVALEIVGLTPVPASNGAFALTLKEVDGLRRLSIVIGQPEAAAIGYELEGMKPPRPMTHDLLKSVIDAMNGQLTEILIRDLRDGTFFASLSIKGADGDIDARPSDAIALAARCNAPIYIMETLIDEAGYEPDDYNEDSDDDNNDDNNDLIKKTAAAKLDDSSKKTGSTIDELLGRLQTAVAQENYEQAAKLRDQIEKLRKEGEN